MKPPVAPSSPYVHEEHGVRREDPWHGLRDREDPRTIAYIEAENRYTEHKLRPLRSLQRALYRSMLERIQEDHSSAPIPRGPWVYYTRTEEGRPYRIHCRAPRDGGEEQIVLDENALAEGHDFLDVGDVAVSPDHATVAYTVDRTGDERYTLEVLSLDTGALLDRIEGVGATFAWGNDSATLYWHELDPTQRPWRVRRRALPGGHAAEDPVVYEDPDGRFYVQITRTRHGRYLLVSSTSSSTAERWLLDPSGDAWCVHPRTEGLLYHVEPAHDGLWIWSNDGDDPDRAAPSFRIYRAPWTARSRDAWTLWQDADPAVSIEGVHAFRSFTVVEERHRGQVRLVVHRGGERHPVQLEDLVHVTEFGPSPEYDAPFFHLRYSSMVRPPSVYRYTPASRSLVLLERLPVPGYDPDAFTTVQHHATAPDGTAIPVSLLWKGGPELPQGRPCLLYGYGAYGLTVEPRFRSSWIALAERGLVVAIAHVRGGGYLGRAWYEAGKLDRKSTTFDDFIAVGRALVDWGVCAPSQLAIMGGSAGGMLVGAVLNRAPDLCRAAIANVPFVDCLNTMLDPSLPLTVGEYEEWGNPQDEDAFHTILSYSPYDNVGPLPYPDLFITSGMNDPRVQFWEPTKWVAKLRAEGRGGEILLKTHMGAGHQGRSGRYGRLEDQAEQYAWLLSKIAPDLLQAER